MTREALSRACRLIDRTGLVTVTSWEDLKITGRVLLRRILDAIQASTACAFEVSSLNENVLFELGYAIALAKPVWLLLETSDAEAKAGWRDFQLLKGVGYAGWNNSEDIRNAYLRDLPHEAHTTLYDDLIEPELGATTKGSLFVVQSYHNTEAARLISRRLDQELRRGVRVLASDPTESSFSPLQWYASKAYETECTILHFEAPRRDLAPIHNRRAALVAGLAYGLDRPVLMLAEEDYSAPLDYEDLLNPYSSARECSLIVDRWLTDRNLVPSSGARTPKVKLARELRALRFGEHVAENERDLLSDYFVETSSFNSVISDRDSLFVGRKGSGKTATMFQAASRLSEDSRNLVVIVKPASYEFAGLLSLLSSLPISIQQYSIEALWKFLLTSEIANSVVDVVEARSSWIPYTDDEKKLLDFVDTAELGLRRDFGTRFEQTVATLLALDLASASEAGSRDLLNEALYSTTIERLRSLLGPVLKSRRRVAVLIDNLDKGWEKAADLDLLSKLLLGLFSAIGRLRTDFAREDYWRDAIRLSVSTFLRSDIFDYVRTVAREPDKLVPAYVTWEDPEVLVRVIEERFLAARPEGTDPTTLWRDYFCQTVRGELAKDYFLARVLPRPRDLIYWCNAAITQAADRGHSRIEEDDVLAAEMAYSHFAFEALLVENGITISELKDVLFQFLGEQEYVTRRKVEELVRLAGIESERVDAVISRLKVLSFLGTKTSLGRVIFAEQRHEIERAEMLARKRVAGEEADSEVLAVHPAFRAYLEIQSTSG